MDRNENEEVVMSQSAHDALMDKAKAGAVEDARKANAAGQTEGRKAERDRVTAILADDKVKGRERIALDLAMKSPDMAAADVIAFVAGLPAASAVPPLADRMAGSGAALALGQRMEAPNASALWEKTIAKMPARKAS